MLLLEGSSLRNWSSLGQYFTVVELENFSSMQYNKSTPLPPKKKVAAPAPKTVVGPQLGAQDAHQVSSKGNAFPLAIDCDSRPPPTLATHRKGRRFPRSPSKFDEQGKSSSLEQLEQSHSFAGCSIVLETAFLFFPWVFASNPLQLHIPDLVVPLNPGLS